jgi:pimeloyl-ACP methyl ester carboxylesterase
VSQQRGAPTESAYVDVRALEMYYERRGGGPPLLLLHGAFGTIESCFAGLLPALASRFEVIAIELQGHGRTRDIARPLTYASMAGDVAAALDAVEIERTHVVGYSMGGAVALQLALDRSDLVDHLVWFGGASYDTSGVNPEFLAGIESFDPHELDGSSWHEAYLRVAPEPDAWLSLVVKLNQLDRAGVSFPAERLAVLRIPTLLMIGGRRCCAARTHRRDVPPSRRRDRRRTWRGTTSTARRSSRDNA